MSLTTEDKETLRKTIAALLVNPLHGDTKEIRIETHGNYCTFQHTDVYEKTSAIACYLTDDYECGTLLSEIDIILNPMSLQQECLLKPKLSRL